MELSMRQNFFCKIDQIQVVWTMRIFYYCMPCLRATSKQKDDRTIVFLFRRVRTGKAAQFFVSAVYKYDTSINAAFVENFPDYRERYLCW